MKLSERLRRYGTALDMPGDHGITATIDAFSDEVSALEDKLEAAGEALAAILDSVEAGKVRLDIYELELAQQAISSIQRVFLVQPSPHSIE